MINFLRELMGLKPTLIAHSWPKDDDGSVDPTGDRRFFHRACSLCPPVFTVA